MRSLSASGEKLAAPGGSPQWPAYTIKFPGDITTYECRASTGARLEFDNSGCGFLAINTDTLKFEVVGGGACNQYQITHRVINWCEFTGESPLKPTVIPRDPDQDNDLSECIWLETTYDPWFVKEYLYDAYSHTDFTLDGTGWKAGTNYGITRIYSAGEDGERDVLPDKVLVRFTCHSGYGYRKPQNVGYLIYRLNRDEIGKDGQPKYEEYCYRSPEGLCNNIYAQPCWTPGYYSFTRYVKIYDNIPPQLTVHTSSLKFCAYGNGRANCDGPVTVEFSASDNCSPRNIQLRYVRFQAGRAGDITDGAGSRYTVTRLDLNRWRVRGNFPMGKHRFFTQIADGCGNTSGGRIDFEVVDCQSPAPVCIQRLSIDLMAVDNDGDGLADGGANTVPAEAFIASDINDCSPSAPAPRHVKYFALKHHELSGGPRALTRDSLTEARRSVRFTCEDPDTSLVYIIALDGAGNFDYCPVSVFLRAGLQPNPCASPDTTTTPIARAGASAPGSRLFTSGFDLRQNVPNPWRQETVIGFVLAKPAEAVLTLQDLSGRVVRVFRGEFDAGYQEFRLTGDQLPSTGIWFYTLRAGKFAATRRMVVLE